MLVLSFNNFTFKLKMISKSRSKSVKFCEGHFFIVVATKCEKLFINKKDIASYSKKELKKQQQ
jgi:hypothetical protein